MSVDDGEFASQNHLPLSKNTYLPKKKKSSALKIFNIALNRGISMGLTSMFNFFRPISKYRLVFVIVCLYDIVFLIQISIQANICLGVCLVFLRYYSSSNICTCSSSCKIMSTILS